MPSPPSRPGRPPLPSSREETGRRGGTWCEARGAETGGSRLLGYGRLQVDALRRRGHRGHVSGGTRWTKMGQDGTHVCGNGRIHPRSITLVLILASNYPEFISKAQAPAVSEGELGRPRAASNPTSTVAVLLGPHASTRTPTQPPAALFSVWTSISPSILSSHLLSLVNLLSAHSPHPPVARLPACQLAACSLLAACQACPAVSSHPVVDASPIGPSRCHRAALLLRPRRPHARRLERTPPTPHQKRGPPRPPSPPHPTPPDPTQP
jgi:hypothetical protein